MIKIHFGFAMLIKVLVLCLSVLKLELSFADDFICDASITKKVLKRYQNLTRYKDKGVLTTKRGGVFTFETVYIKPDELKFIFYSPPGYGAYEKMSFIMSTNTTTSIFESERFGIRKWDETSVRSLLQSAAGVTSVSSLVIPPLLVGMYNVWAHESPINMALESSEKDVTFCRVYFERKSGAKEIYWLQKNGTIIRFRRESNSLRHLVSDIKFQIIEMKY